MLCVVKGFGLSFCPMGCLSPFISNKLFSLMYHNGLFAPDQSNSLVFVFKQHNEISIPSFTSSLLFSKVSNTNSLVLSNIFAGSVMPNSFTVRLRALLQTTLTIAPETPCPVQSAAANKTRSFTFSIQ